MKIEQQKRLAAQRARLHLAIKKSAEDREKAEILISSALNLVREPSSQAALRAGRAALKAAFGPKYPPVRNHDLLRTLLADASFFSNAIYSNKKERK